LTSWENALLEREKKIDLDEENLHKEIMSKRQNIESEIKKVLDVSRSSADNLLQSAKSEAESLKKSSQIEAESVQKKAYNEGFSLGQEKGFAKGEKEGLHEGKLEWQGLIKETDMLIQELQTSRMGILKSVEEEMLKLVFGFSKRVIKIESLVQPSIVLENIHEAIGKVAEVDKIVLRINLKDKSMVESHKEEFLSHLSGVNELRIIEDGSIAPGGVKIETGVGTIDATIETQVEELERAMMSFFHKA
ncbi:hypothetical protein HYY75_12610, partial [bacterium]|nr:hypothetical protein [bacterium]